MTAETVASVCPHDCPGACALDVERLTPDRIGRIKGAKAMPYTDGVICAKVARYAERVHHPDRLTVPLLRTGPKGAGEFTPISWDEALDRVADAFKAAVAEHGPEAIWPYNYAGTMGMLQREGMERFRRTLGTSLMAGTICSAIGAAGWDAGMGKGLGANPLDMEQADLIVLWGMNPVASQVNVMTHAAKARKERGAKLVVIDPYRSPTAEKADLHIAPRAGTDDALACAVIQVLLAEGWADRDFLARHTDFDAEAETHFAAKTPAWAAALTGLSEEDIVGLARMIGATKRTFIRMGYGLTRSRNGAAKVHAIAAIPAVTGAWTHRGGGALIAIGGVFAGLDKALINGSDIPTPARTLDMCQLGRVLTGDGDALHGGPPVTAMLIQNTNPAVVAPESLRVREGFEREDLFLCVHEQFMTDTAKYADVVLPATTFLEHADLYRSYGQTFLQVARPVLEPLGESRSNHQVFRGLAERLGLDHPAFFMTEWELIDATLKRSGLPGADDLAEKRWMDFSDRGKAFTPETGFPTADGRFRFRADWASVGLDHERMPPLPDHMAVLDETDDEHPFRLVTGPARQFLNTTFTETSSSLKAEARPTAKLHPDDAARLAVADGGTVRLGNRRGAVTVHAEVTEASRPGLVVVESIWPNAYFPEGYGINALISADRVPPAGGAAFHDTAIWVKPVGKEQ